MLDRNANFYLSQNLHWMCNGKKNYVNLVNLEKSTDFGSVNYVVTMYITWYKYHWKHKKINT